LVIEKLVTIETNKVIGFHQQMMAVRNTGIVAAAAFGFGQTEV
jgi:hypothetical protein